MDDIKVGDIVEPKDPNRPLISGSHAYHRAVVCSLFPFILISECTEMRWSKREQHQFNIVGTATPEILKECMNRLHRDHRITQIK